MNWGLKDMVKKILKVFLFLNYGILKFIYLNYKNYNGEKQKEYKYIQIINKI